MIWRATHPAHLVLGLTVWCLWFVVIYSTLSVGCAVSAPGVEAGPFTWINAALLVITLATTALLISWALFCWRGAPSPADGHGRFMARVSAALHGLSAGAALAVGLPVIFLPPCV